MKKELSEKEVAMIFESIEAIERILKKYYSDNPAVPQSQYKNKS